MAEKQNKLRVVVGADTGKLTSGLKYAKMSVSDFAKTVGNIKIPTMAIGASIAAAVGSIATIAHKGMSAWSESIDSVTKLNRAIANSGELAGGYSAQLQDAAAEIQALTRYEDDATMSLMGMGIAAGIPAAKIAEATKAAYGLQDSLGIAPEQALKAMGRAAQGNIPRMKEMGIVLKDGATAADAYNALIEKGNAGYQVSIDRAGTYSGRLEQISNTIGDMWEGVGRFFESMIGGGMAIDYIAGKFKDLSAWINEGAQSWGLTIGIFFVDLYNRLKYTGNMISWTWNFIQSELTKGFANVFIGIDWIGRNWKKVWDNALVLAMAIFNDLSSNFANMFTEVFDWLKSGFTDPIELKFSMDNLNAVKESVGLEQVEYLKGLNFGEEFAKASSRELDAMAKRNEDYASSLADKVMTQDAALSGVGMAVKEKAVESTQMAGKVDKGTQFASAAERGSTEAYSTIIRALQGGRDNYAAKTATNTERMAKNTEALVDSAKQQSAMWSDLLQMEIL
jgi:hypothetical protein